MTIGKRIKLAMAIRATLLLYELVWSMNHRVSSQHSIVPKVNMIQCKIVTVINENDTI